MWLKTALSWVEDKWAKFEAWVASWMPGFKTRLVSGLGAVGMLAASVQEYISQLPLSQFMTATQVAITATVVLTLAFWLRGLSDRVALRAPSNS